MSQSQITSPLTLKPPLYSASALHLIYPKNHSPRSINWIKIFFLPNKVRNWLTRSCHWLLADMIGVQFIVRCAFCRQQLAMFYVYSLWCIAFEQLHDTLTLKNWCMYMKFYHLINMFLYPCLMQNSSTWADREPDRAVYCGMIGVHISLC